MPELSAAFSAPPEFTGGREPSNFRLLNRCSTTAPLLPFIFWEIIGLFINGVHAFALVHAVAGIHAFPGVFNLWLALLLLAYIILPYYMTLPASMLLQVFFCAVTRVHALVLTHALVGTHTLASVSAVVGCRVPGRRPFAFPNAGNATFYIPQCWKILVTEARPGLQVLILQV